MIKRDRLVQTFCDIAKIDSPSGEEEDMAKDLTARLESLGFTTMRDDYGNLVDVGISKDLENIPSPITAGGKGTRFLTADSQRNIEGAVDKYNLEGDDTPEFDAEEVSFGGLEDSNVKRTAMGDALLQAKVDTMGKQTGYRMV